MGYALKLGPESIYARQLAGEEYIQANGFGGTLPRTRPVAQFTRGDQVYEIAAFQRSSEFTNPRSTIFSVIPTGEKTTVATILGGLDSTAKDIFTVRDMFNHTKDTPEVDHVKGAVEQTITTLLQEEVIDKWVASELPGTLSSDENRMYSRLRTRDNGLVVVRNRFDVVEVFKAA